MAFRQVQSMSSLKEKECATFHDSYKWEQYRSTLNTRSNQLFASTVKKVDMKGLNVNSSMKLDSKQKFEGTTINEKDKVIPQQPPQRQR